MTSSSDQKTKKCLCCKGELPPRKPKRFCSSKCRYRYHNEQRRQENEQEYGREKKLRHNVKVLKKLLAHPFYQNNRIAEVYLRYEGFHFDTLTFPMEIKEAGKPVRKIAWSHNYGIQIVEVKKFGTEDINYFTIHVNKKEGAHV